MDEIKQQVFLAVTKSAQRGGNNYYLLRALEQIAIDVAEGMKKGAGYNKINGIDKSKWAKAPASSEKAEAYKKYLKCKG